MIYRVEKGGRRGRKSWLLARVPAAVDARFCGRPDFFSGSVNGLILSTELAVMAPRSAVHRQYCYYSSTDTVSRDTVRLGAKAPMHTTIVISGREVGMPALVAWPSPITD